MNSCPVQKAEWRRYGNASDFSTFAGGYLDACQLIGRRIEGNAQRSGLGGEAHIKLLIDDSTARKLSRRRSKHTKNQPKSSERKKPTPTQLPNLQSTVACPNGVPPEVHPLLTPRLAAYQINSQPISESATDALPAELHSGKLRCFGGLAIELGSASFSRRFLASS